MHRGDHGHRQVLDAVEQPERPFDRILDFVLGVVAVELADISAGDEA